MELAIDYVSPLPPVRSGIADYSRDLLPFLEETCDLRVVRVPGQPVSEAMERRWRPASAEQLGEAGRLPVYHMGNNVHHAPVAELAEARPGVVVLHDLALHHLLVERTLGAGELAPYLEALRRDHGWVGETAALARRWGELGESSMFELSANRSLVQSQRGVLVHSSWAAEQLREESASLCVEVVTMAMPLPEARDRSAAGEVRARWGVPSSSPLLGSFGFQTPIKRTDRVIRALAEEPLADAHLLVGGEISPALDLNGLAEKLGVEDRVHFLGFLAYEEFLAAIGATDLCVNLRYPTAGETSASLLRVLAMGVPTLVSDYAQFAELPDGVVAKIQLGDGEVEQLALRTRSLLTAPERLAELGETARVWVREQHDPTAAAERFAEACARCGEREAPGTSAVGLPGPTTLAWRELGGRLEVAGWPEDWAAGAARELRITLCNESSARWLSTAYGTGGVFLELQWRDEVWGEVLETTSVSLPTDLDPEEQREWTVRVRRPPGGTALIVEPHVQGVSGFNALGGPRAILTLDGASG